MLQLFRRPDNTFNVVSGNPEKLSYLETRKQAYTKIRLSDAILNRLVSSDNMFKTSKGKKT